MHAPISTFSQYGKLAFVLLSISIIIAILYLGQNIVIPLLFALLFAILLRPVVIFFNKKLRFPHAIAVLVAVVLSVIFISTIVFFVSWQVSDIIDDWNKIKYNLNIHYKNIQYWINQHYHISYDKQPLAS